MLGQAYRASTRSHGNSARIRQEKLRLKAKEITTSGISKLASYKIQASCRSWHFPDSKIDNKLCGSTMV